MSNHSHAPVDVDPAALDQAHNVWHGFTALMKYALIGIVAVLIAMFVFLL